MNNTVPIWTNQLLQQKQMVIDVLHPGNATVPKAKNQQKTSQNVQDHNGCHLFIYGFRTHSGGGKTMTLA